MTSTKEEITYLKTEFLERIAHELRGPAGVTLGALDELDRFLAEDAFASDHARTLFTMARRGVYRVLRTAERLQRTAQLERGHLDESRVAIDVKSLVHLALEAAKLVESRPAVSIDLNAPNDPFIVFVNGPWMVMALTELILNAVRNASKKVKIEVSPQDAHNVNLFVIDDGEGFSTQWVRRFASQARRQGLGLSLSLVQDVAQAHAGNFSIRSVEQNVDMRRGACTCISLPLGVVAAS